MRGNEMIFSLDRPPFPPPCLCPFFFFFFFFFLFLFFVFRILSRRSSCHSAAETNLTRNHEVVGLILGLAKWVKDLALLWLWCRLAAAALIQTLAWELLCAAGATLKSKN